MSELFYCILIILSIQSSVFSQTCQGCSQGQSRGGVPADRSRSIPAGRGQEFRGNFRSVNSMHFVQFAVYPSSIACNTIKAPEGLGMIWLINHSGTYVRGQSHSGAYYVVKAFKSKYQAQVHVSKYKHMGIDCWVNAALTGSNFHIERIFM